MSATVIAFPTDTFRPVDQTELRRWDAAAFGVDRFCLQDPDNSGQWVERDEQGERVWITQGDRMSAPLFCVLPRYRRWELVECRHFRAVGAFRSLRAALETVCRTLPGVAAQDRASAEMA